MAHTPAPVHLLPGLPDTTTADARGRRIAVLPVGSYEQHGDHLPLATDSLVACLIARRLAHTYGLLLLPPVTMSCSHEHAGSAGTVSISATTLHAIVGDVWRSLRADGVEGLVVVNGHGGNYVLGNVVQEANVEAAAGRETRPRMVLFPGRDDWQRARTAAGLVTDSHADMHGGELEVSLLLHGAPGAVRPGVGADDHLAPERSLLLALGMRAYTANGVIGRPSLGTADKGRAVLDSLTTSAAAYVELLGGDGGKGAGDAD